jgi:hypothetical protein
VMQMAINYASFIWQRLNFKKLLLSSSYYVVLIK